MNPTTVTVILATILLQQMVTGFDYCQAGLCTDNKVDIGCNASGDFGPKCPSVHALVPMTDDLKAYTLQKHNQVRRDIANGNKYNGFATANRMIEMTWDDELAKLAEYLAKTCVWGHDQCRNTDAYRYAGQNLAQATGPPTYFATINAVIDYLFIDWVNEYTSADMTYISSYHNNPTTDIGHFTQIITAGANKVGCAMTTYAANADNSVQNSFWVCNYSLTNMLGQAVYTTGAPGSACTTGGSVTYPGLCSSAEVIQ